MTWPWLCTVPWEAADRLQGQQHVEDPTVPQSVQSPPAPPHFSPSWNALQHRDGAVSSASAASPRAFQKLGCNRKTTQAKCRDYFLATSVANKFYTLFRLGPTVFKDIKAGTIPASRQSALCPATITGPRIHTGLNFFR